MQRKPMVHMVVLAALVIGTIAIIPSAMAHHTDATDEAQCKKWHIQAINDYVDKGQVPPGIQKLLMECLQGKCLLHLIILRYLRQLI